MKKVISTMVVICLILSVFCIQVSAQESTNETVGIPILLYHNLADYVPGQEYASSLNIPAYTFELHIRTIIKAGYTPITYEMYYQHMTEGTELPEKPIMITFDDGYLSNYLYAYPILKQYNAKATIFVITDRRGKALGVNPHFSWNQAREMVDSGIIDIQSHTHSHQVSTTLTDEELAYEMRMSKRLVEMNTGKKCNVIAFPNGIAQEREKQAALDAGYKIINMVGDNGINYYGDSLSDVKRITVFGHWTAQDLLNHIQMHLAS